MQNGDLWFNESTKGAEKKQQNIFTSDNKRKIIKKKNYCIQRLILNGRRDTFMLCQVINVGTDLALAQISGMQFVVKDNVVLYPMNIWCP